MQASTMSVSRMLFGLRTGAVDVTTSTETVLVEATEESSVALPGKDLAEKLHHTEYPGLVRFLLLQGASWPEAQDAAQDAFTQMCRPATSITYPKAWLRKVAWRSWVRQQVTVEETCAEPPDTSPATHWQTPDHAVEINEEGRAVLSQLLKLPAKQRAAMAWFLDGFTTEESARAMGISPTAVRQNLSRARASLKVGRGLERGADDDEKGEV
jgi:RNA polymerase sigma factor (sigma-70 family)